MVRTSELERRRAATALVEAAAAHGRAVGDSGMAFGDLESLLIEAFLHMDAAQYRAFWRRDGVAELVGEIPEYAGVARSVGVEPAGG